MMFSKSQDGRPEQTVVAIAPTRPGYASPFPRARKRWTSLHARFSTLATAEAEITGNKKERVVTALNNMIAILLMDIEIK